MRMIPLLISLSAILAACSAAAPSDPAAEPTQPPSAIPAPEPTASPTEEPPGPAVDPRAENITVSTLVDEIDAGTGGLAVDASGNLYFADIGYAPSRGGSTIYRITPGGEVSVFAQDESISGASGMAFDSEGNLYVSSYNGGVINKITPDGEVSVYIEEKIFGSVGLVFDENDNLYIADCHGGAVKMARPGGSVSILSQDPRLRCPNGITRDSDGNLYIVTFNGGRVFLLPPDGELEVFAELPSDNGAHIVLANGIFYITDRGGHQVFSLDMQGNLGLLAGSGEQGKEDGHGLTASFYLPNGIAVSPDGHTLYINHVRKPTKANNAPVTIRVIDLGGD